MLASSRAGIAQAARVEVKQKLGRDASKLDVEKAVCKEIRARWKGLSSEELAPYMEAAKKAMEPAACGSATEGHRVFAPVAQSPAASVQAEVELDGRRLGAQGRCVLAPVAQSPAASLQAGGA